MDWNIFKTYVEERGVVLDAKEIEQLDTYWNYLLEVNAHTNLTRITDPKEAMAKHFLDSASILEAVCDLEKAPSILDVGTGAGFPGIVISILFPHIPITLLDARQKKVNFLLEVIKKLGLKNTRAIHGRIEECFAKERAAVVVTRALDKMPLRMRDLHNSVLKDGFLIVYAGPRECSAEKIPNAQVVKVTIEQPVSLEHRLVIVPAAKNAAQKKRTKKRKHTN